MMVIIINDAINNGSKIIIHEKFTGLKNNILFISTKILKKIGQVSFD